MANNEIKTNAEIYREQRKARLAKAAKKKKSGKGDKVVRVLLKTLCIVLIAGIVIYGVGNILSKVFFVPQKVLTAATYEDEKVSVAEFNYYYLSLYRQVLSQAQQYESYYGTGYGVYATGFDMYTDPAQQDCVHEDLPETIVTWADYFKYSASQKAILNKAIYDIAMSEAAKKEGFALTEEQKTAIDTEIADVMRELEQSAKEQDFALDTYISNTCGKGLNAKTYKALVERDAIVEEYVAWYRTHTSESLTDKEIKAYYEENKENYDYASAKIFRISYAEPKETDKDSKDPVYTKKEAKKLADEFLGKVTDPASFVATAKEYAIPSEKDDFKKETATDSGKILKSQVESTSKDLAKWMFASERAVGDKVVIDDSKNELYYIALMVDTAAPDTQTAGADVRHILVKAETTKQDTEGNTINLSDKEIEKNFAEAKKEADALLAEWKKGEATEETFSKLAADKTDDTASAESGGLYEDITATSSYVPEFLDWALAEHKKGDTGIIKTDYGYHIMYFVDAEEDVKWESDVRNAISTEKAEDFVTDIHNEIKEKISANDSLINWFAKDLEKTLAKNAEYYKSSASSSNSSSFSY